VIVFLKAGATPVPIDYTFPPARIGAILAIAAPKAALTDGALSAESVALTQWLDVEELIARNPAPVAAVAGQLDDLVYVLFTSGSTGTPKGVAMGQRTLVNLVQWQHGTSSADGARTLNRSSIGFDVGFQEIFSTLCFGQTLIVASETERADVVGLAPLIERRRVDRIFIPPVSLIQIAEAIDEKATPLASLRHVIVAGEAMRVTPAIVRLFRSCNARVTNQYGPTETHVATSWDLQGPSMRWPRLPPIGRPIANARVHILDAAGQRCPVGVRGEIAIGGLLPAKGYLGQAAETAKRFVPDPFADDPAGGAVMYLTGDFGRLTADGIFEFLGRRDDQVKLRGYRIELGDIEAHANAVPGVKIAAAVLREREQSGPYIALFVEPQAGAVLDPRRIRESLVAKLPEHMVPSLGTITILQQLPINRNGKVDRKRLPEIAEHAADLGEGECGALDEQIEGIWRRYLNVGDIRREDGFMALGGHSLLAIQIASRVNDRFGIAVPVATLLRGGSFGRFVDTVADHIAMKSKCAAAVQRPVDRRAAATLYEVRLADGRTVVTPYPEEAHHYHREIIERGVYLRHGISLGDADIVVDVGANIGLFSLAVLSQRPGCRVIAVEPAPLPAAALSHNLSAVNGNATLLEVGFSDRDGEREFTFYPNVTGMSSFVPDAAADRALLASLVANARSASADVDRALAGNEPGHLDARLVSERFMRPVERLSTLIGRLGLERIDLLKIDVQRGSEAVLDGIDDADWRKIRQIVVEYQNLGGRRSPVEERLIRAGYRVTTEQDDIHRGTNVVYTYATRAP
jgi:amino acid adenylation domain-containing protein/FkbM family methyltransferase